MPSSSVVHSSAELSHPNSEGEDEDEAVKVSR